MPTQKSFSFTIRTDNQTKTKIKNNDAGKNDATIQDAKTRETQRKKEKTSLFENHQKGVKRVTVCGVQFFD